MQTLEIVTLPLGSRIKAAGEFAEAWQRDHDTLTRVADAYRCQIEEDPGSYRPEADEALTDHWQALHRVALELNRTALPEAQRRFGPMGHASEFADRLDRMDQNARYGYARDVQDGIEETAGQLIGLIDQNIVGA